MSRRKRTPIRKRLRRLQLKVFELKSLLELHQLEGARDEAVVARMFVHTAMGSVFAESAAAFRLELGTGILHMWHDSVMDRKLPRLSLSAEQMRFLGGSEARSGIWLKSRELSPEAGAFALDIGEWNARCGFEVLIPLSTHDGLWGLVGFGPRLGATKDRPRPYTRSALGRLAKAAQTAEGFLRSLAHEPAAAKTAGAAGPPPAAPSAFQLSPDSDLPSLRREYPALEEIVGDSPALASTLRELAQVAPTRVPVLILGPTGTGKELAARAIHRMSPRADGPFEVVDCGAIPRELIESELFGHVRGAFTGATRDRRGAFELAHNGTLFLDEIGELPPGAQTRLLRVLQEGQLRRVGDERPIHVSVRVVAATNRDLARMAQEGRFRSDLFYRVSVFTAQMPALADRREDLPLLARYFLSRLAAETGRPEPKLSPALLRRLAEYHFPGNVRELQNVLTRLVLRAGAEGPTVEDLDAAIAQSGDRPSPAAASAGARAIEDDLDVPGRGDAGKIGPWVVAHLRRHEFNLSQAERALDRIQRSPAGKSAAPVADRASLNYYLQGELLRCFHETGYDVEHSARNVSGNAELAPRVRHRLRKLLARIAEGIGSFGEEDAARRAARKLFPKLPAYYNPHVDAAAVAFVRGEWSRPPAEALVADEDED